MGILCTTTGPEFLESDLNTALHYLKRAESQGHPKASQEIAIIQDMLAHPNSDQEGWG